MTLPQHPFRQAIIAGVAILTTTLTFGAAVAPAPAQAQSQSSVYYRATLEQPVNERQREIIRGGTFVCSGTVCMGTKARSRPEVVCKKLASEFGPVAAFSVEGTDLTAEELADCRSEAG